MRRAPRVARIIRVDSQAGLVGNVRSLMLSIDRRLRPPCAGRIPRGGQPETAAAPASKGAGLERSRRAQPRCVISSIISSWQRTPPQPTHARRRPPVCPAGHETITPTALASSSSATPHRNGTRAARVPLRTQPCKTSMGTATESASELMQCHYPRRIQIASPANNFRGPCHRTPFFLWHVHTWATCLKVTELKKLRRTMTLLQLLCNYLFNAS
eukprot:937230-Prymnesium_polylepis.1